MRAVALDFEQRTIGWRHISVPSLQADNEVLFRVREVGICGTDRELARFRFGSPPRGETVLAIGHEALGEVIAAGSDTGFAAGDLVVPMLRRSCDPACPCCSAGRRDLCQTGQYLERGIVGLHGYFTEQAVDLAADLIRIPYALASVAVLVEPLSVVEKALESALRAHPAVPKTALVLGAGPIGLLTALALAHRSIAVTIHSLEAAEHPRAALAKRAGLAYTASSPQCADLVFEASGSPMAAARVPALLAPLGVGVLIGASDFAVEFPGVRMVVENLTILGVVNASRSHFEAAVEDLGRFDRKAVSGLIARRPASSFPDSIHGIQPEPKTVHPID
jgi:glucose 1-dehydrogenase